MVLFEDYCVSFIRFFLYNFIYIAQMCYINMILFFLGVIIWFEELFEGVNWDGIMSFPFRVHVLSIGSLDNFGYHKDHSTAINEARQTLALRRPFRQPLPHETGANSVWVYWTAATSSGLWRWGRWKAFWFFWGKTEIKINWAFYWRDDTG